MINIMKSLFKPTVLFFYFLLFSLYQISSATIIDTLTCKNNTKQQYAIFLPDEYSEKEKYPAIFFFEPGARATLPLNKYKDLANKYELILACSWNARNGPAVNNDIAADAMVTDVFLNYSIDTSMILLSGFSGGARFCYRYAKNNNLIKGVIACGAGLDDYSQKIIPPRFVYTAIIGNSDFNFYEIYQLKQAFAKNNYSLPTFVFSGDHKWPDSSTFEKALYVHFQSSFQEKIQLFNTFQDLELTAINQAQESGDLVLLSWSYENIATYSLYPDMRKAYNDTLNSLIKSKEYRVCKRNFKNALVEEDSLRREIEDALYGIYLTTYNQFENHKPLSWWKHKIKKVTKLTLSKDLYERLLGEKILGHIRVQTWELFSKLKEQGFFNASLECTEVLLLLDNSNPWYWTFKAQMLSELKMDEEAKKLLDELLLHHPQHIVNIKNDKLLLKYLSN